MQPFLQWNSGRCSEGVRSQYQTWLRRLLHNYRAHNYRRLDLRTRIRLEYMSCDPTRHQVQLALLQYFDLLFKLGLFGFRPICFKLGCN